ncbi:hypothetical protein FS749_013170 [Ceratobasidium sp. UAMH 11750]|nr:hypothetical protein FS749_013170 [Ceratobasidium sp. UAMH 11750]
MTSWSRLSNERLNISTSQRPSTVGFAAARAKLEDPVHKAAHEDVYKRMAAFFKKHL